MGKFANIILYHATWCGHCKTFMPEWEKLTSKIKNNKHITFNSYDSEQEEAKNATINGGSLKGFPTIKITIDDNGKKTEIDYMGKRRADEIIDFISQKIK
jgi:hypothetical protein